MATLTKVSELPEAVTLGASSVLPAVSSSGANLTSVKITIANLAGNLSGLITLSSSISASTAATASSADNFLVRQSLTASNANITGTLRATNIVVQTITSSVIVYSTGSSIFGNELSDTHQFTGSVSITGSLLLNGGSLSSFTAVSQSYAALSGSFRTGSFTGSFIGNLQGTASYATTTVSSSYPFTVSGSTLYNIALDTPTNFSVVDSVLVGARAGRGTLGKTDIIAIGKDATNTVDASDYSVVIGNRAASGSYIPNSVVIGHDAGLSSSFAEKQVSIGRGAGSESDMLNSIIIGWYAGQKSRKINPLISATSNILIGYAAGFSMGDNMNSIFIGSGSGNYAKNSDKVLVLGYGSGQGVSSSLSSNFIGQFSGYYSEDVDFSNIIGHYSGYRAYSSSYTNFFGAFSGYQTTGSDHSILIGTGVGRKLAGSGISTNNIIIGKNITLENGRKDSLNIGAIIFATGSYSDNPVSAYDANPAFSGSVGGGRVGINVVTPVYNLDVSGSGNYTNNLTVTGSLFVSSSIVLTPSGSISVVSGSIISRAFTGSLFGTSSWAVNAATASSIGKLNQNVEITGSVVISGSSSVLSVTGSNSVSGALFVNGGNVTLSGSLLLQNRSATLPAAPEGSLAASGSNLYFYSASAWRKVTLV